MKRILIVDDDDVFRSSVRDLLRKEFHTVESATAMQSLALAASELPDLILLDLNLPDLNGFEVCKRLRENPNTRAIPVIFLTGEAGIDSRVTGLDLGADNYICKPCDPRELQAHIRARLRRGEIEASERRPLELGNLKLDPTNRQAILNESPIKLTETEFTLLRYLIERSGTVNDRKILVSHLWPDAIVTVRTIDTHIAKIRKKLQGFSGQLETVRGIGYLIKVD